MDFKKIKSTTGYPFLREVIMRLIVRRIRRLVPVVHKPVGREGTCPPLHGYIILQREKKVNIQSDDFLSEFSFKKLQRRKFDTKERFLSKNGEKVSRFAGRL